jgi:GGDEF domain-containing protein
MRVAEAAERDKNKSSREGGFWGKLAFPPILLIPIFIAVMSADTTRASARIFVPSLFAVLISYVGMSILFVSLRQSGMKKAANAVSLLSSGFLLLILSSSLGLGDIFGWVATALLVGGLILVMSQIMPPVSKKFPKAVNDLLPENVSPVEVKKLLDAMAFPSAFLKNTDDGDELVVAINEAFAAMLGKNNHQVKDVSFSSVLPGNEKAVSFKFSGSEWVPHRTTRGVQTLFMLTPLIKTTEEFVGPTDAIDRETGLFTPLFLKYRATADVEACRRYGRRMAVVLFRLTFDRKPLIPSDEKVNKACVAFGKMVAASLRACDSGYRLKVDEVLIFLPDTPQSGSKTVVSRIEEKAKKLAKVEVAELALANIQDVTLNYFGEEVTSVDQVMNDIYVKIGRVNELQMINS